MTKPENLTKTILHGLTAVFGVLILGFLALPFISIDAVAAMGMPASSKVGYDFLDFSTPNPTSEEIFCAVVTLLLVIFACVLIVSAILSLLGDFGIISNEKFAKATKWLNVISALIVLVLTVLSFVACTNLVSSLNENYKQLLKVELVHTAFAGLALNLICGAGASACALYNTFKK